LLGVLTLFKLFLEGRHEVLVGALAQHQEEGLVVHVMREEYFSAQINWQDIVSRDELVQFVAQDNDLATTAMLGAALRTSALQEDDK
jgi:hypothetical protein